MAIGGCLRNERKVATAAIEVKVSRGGETESRAAGSERGSLQEHPHAPDVRPRAASLMPVNGNMSFLLAGSDSINPVLFTLAIGLILAWKVAGYYGFDRYLLPMLGTPWRPLPRAHPQDAATAG
jgi:hypothetical protein